MSKVSLYGINLSPMSSKLISVSLRFSPLLISSAIYLIPLVLASTKLLESLLNSSLIFSIQ